MWWQEDDLADKLIANNAARPIPGMEKPDMARLGSTGAVPRKTSMPAKETSRSLRQRTKACAEGDL